MLNLEIMQECAAVRALFEKEGKRPKAYINTFGCQQNEADSERLAGMCAQMGYTMTGEPDEASLILVNTCAVREHAEKKALSIIGQYSHIKKRDPSVVIGVGGCMATEEHRALQLKRSYPYVSFVFDTGSVHRLPFLVHGALEGKPRKTETCGGDFRITEGIPTLPFTPWSAWLSVMYGCNNFCTYCIVPYTRGRERSRSPEAILDEARRLIDVGAKEITLLGQNVNSYGHDLDSGVDFADIMRAVCRLDGDFRVRFMTSHPKDASDKLISVMAEEGKVVPHFHLPLQSGSDEILRRMNRRYTVERYMSVVEKLRAAIPDISITTDIIVGFPGETEEDFNGTLDVVRAANYDLVYSFIYSPRVGTPAASMENQVPKDVVDPRFARLLELQDSLSLERNKRFVGREIDVLAESVSKKNGCMLTGRGDPVRPVHFAGDESLIGQKLRVRITEAETYSLNAEIIK